MDEKLKKAIKTSKQGVIILLVLSGLMYIFNIIAGITALKTAAASSVILTILEASWVNIVRDIVLIIGLVLYGKDKYLKGARVIQLAGFGSILVTIASVVINYVAGFSTSIIAIIGSAIIPIILIIEALKVIRLTEDFESPSDNVTIPAIIIMVLVLSTFIGITIYKLSIVNEIKDQIKDQITNIGGNNNQNELPSVDKDDEKEPEQQPSEDDKEKFDPYASYKNINWATTSVTDSKSGATLSIENSVVYLTEQGKKAKVTGITGTPTKVLFLLNMQVAEFYILTKEGQIYQITGYETSASLHLKNQAYVDMTILNNYTNESVYFLTADGKLVDKNGVSYNKYNFVNEYIMGRSGVSISIDKDYYGYHYDAKTNTYKALVNKANNAKLIMSKIYLDNDNRALIITTGNRLFIYNEQGYSLNTEGTVKTLNKRENSDGTKDLVVTFDDGSKKIYPNIVEGYDVKNKKELSVTSLAKFDPYASYKDLTWNTTTKVTDVYGGIYEIKSGKLYYKNKVVSGISGTPLKLKTDTMGGAFGLYIVTNANKVYCVVDDSTAELYVDLSKHEIIDMTIIKENHGQEYNYFLTSTGNLIDKNGVAYDKNKFTDSYGLNIITKISIDKNLYGYYYDGKTYSAVQDKASGEKIVLSKIYTVNGYDLALILSKTNKLYEYDGKSNKATYIGELDKIKQASNDNNDYLTIKVYLKNGNSKSYEDVDKTAYDVVNKKKIDLTTLEKILSVIVSTDVASINDKLVLAYVDLRTYNPTIGKFDINATVTVNRVQYNGLFDYYKKVVPEVDETSSKYKIPEGYNLDIKENGAASIVKK